MSSFIRQSFFVFLFFFVPYLSILVQSKFLSNGICPLLSPFQFADAQLVCIAFCATDGVGDYVHLETIDEMLNKNGYKTISIALLWEDNIQQYEKYINNRKPNKIISIINKSRDWKSVREDIKNYPGLVDAFRNLPIFQISYISMDLIDFIFKKMLENFQPIVFVSEWTAQCLKCVSRRPFCHSQYGCMGIPPYWREDFPTLEKGFEGLSGLYLGIHFDWDLINETANANVLQRRRQILPNLEDRSLRQAVHSHSDPDKRIFHRDLFINIAISLSKNVNRTTLDFFVGDVPMETYIESYRDFLVNIQQINCIEMHTQCAVTGNYTIKIFSLDVQESHSVDNPPRWKKLRFFKTYLSAADMTSLYKIADGPIGGSGDNTFAQAWSYSPSIVNDTGYSFPPFAFFQLPPFKTILFKRNIPAWLRAKKLDSIADYMLLFSEEVNSTSIDDKVNHFVSKVNGTQFSSQYAAFLDLVHTEYNFEDHFLKLVTSIIDESKNKSHVAVNK